MKQATKLVPFNDILPDDKARRVSSSVESIDSLKKSIASLGLLDPIIVEELPGNKYRLCAGRNRYTAIKSLIEDDGQARFDEVPCTVLEFDDHELVDENYKSYKISQVIFDSNDKRTQLTKFEQAGHYAAQKKQFPHLFPTDAELARFNNKPVNEVVEAMRLLALDPDVINRVEELNLQNPGTIPFMCLEEIAEAAAQTKRPLPREGQLRIIDLLVSPDLTDKRALVARDKMKALVTAIRKEYAPDPRGRKPKNETQTQVSSSETNTNDLFEAVSESYARPEESVSTNDLSIRDSFGDPQKEAISKDNSYKAVSENGNADTLHKPDDSSRNGVVSSETGVAITTPKNPDVTEPTHTGATSPTLKIVDLSIDTALDALRKGLPTLTQEQYQERAQKLEELRRLLEAAAFALN